MYESCIQSAVKSADMPPLPLHSPISAGSSPPTPTIVYVAQYEHLLNLVIF